MLRHVKKLVPQSAINSFHYVEALAADFAYRHPTGKMITIGIVGSKGKTTLANLLWASLSGDGSKVGLVGTANIRLGDDEETNPYHMTMPGRHRLQKTLARMEAAGCSFAILEVPSEGQAQWRHVGVHFDVLVFTNVTRELMASHNYSLEILHQHNQRVFHQFANSKTKTLEGRVQPKILIANADAEHFPTYFSHLADIKRSYSVKAKSDYQAKFKTADHAGSSFAINQQTYHINLPGTINISNAAGAIAAALELGKTPAAIAKGLKNLAQVAGRMERIEAGQGFTVIVDYAHEETGMAALMESARLLAQSSARVITLLGAEGGGRDEAKRPIMGRIAMKGSDVVILTNVDPYSDDPEAILDDIAAGVEKAGGRLNKTYFRIADRRQGIHQALALAKAGDVVFITGKGSEQSIIIDGKKSAWDDRLVVAEELTTLTSPSTKASGGSRNSKNR